MLPALPYPISSPSASHELGPEAIAQGSEYIPEKPEPPKRDLPLKRPAGSRKVKPKKQNLNSISQSDAHQLTEDNLFELLVKRIRQREDDEAAAEGIRRQVEEHNRSLSKENQALRSELKELDAQLQKSMVESSDARSQLEEWKTKIRKFRTVVNDLGREYDALREESDKLREATISLGQEKADLNVEIERIRLHVAQAEETVDKQRDQILDRENRIAMLEQALSVSKGHENDSVCQIEDQKRKIVTLEAYIQNYSLSHARQLSTMRDDQAKLHKRVDAGFDLLIQKADETKDSMISTAQQALEECRSSIQSLTEQSTSQQIDVQNFTDEANHIVSQLNRLSVQFAEGVNGSTTLNTNASKAIEDGLGLIERHFGSDSPLFTELSNSEKLHESLTGQFQAMEPKLNHLDNSVTSLIGNERKLLESLDTLRETLADEQIRTGKAVLEAELAKRANENVQLQVQNYKISFESELLQKSLKEQEATIKKYLTAIDENKARVQVLEQEVYNLTAEKVALGGEIETTKLEMRQELTQEKQALKEQIKAQYEPQLINLRKDKLELEEASADLIKKLGDIQHALIDARRVVEQLRKERELLVQETEQQVVELTKSCSESNAQLVAQTGELQRFQELDAASRVENSSLREQLEQAQETILHLEQRPTAPAKGDDTRDASPGNVIVPFATMEGKLSPTPAESPFHESCDFAMLFMSDEEAGASVPAEKVRDISSQERNLKRRSSNSKKATNSPDGDKRTNKSPLAKKKRKVSISEAPRQLKSARVSPSGQMTTSTAEENKNIENSASKISKHIHKWTYSRIHSTATQLQRQQSATSVRSAASGRSVVERRTSPQGLVSASSAVEVPKRKSSRGRGRGRSRNDRYHARFNTEE
ncbi:hypothetical protein N7470_004155 [Penicillium chermesinum]|nr:hypothetical protein N7470_004155 [Penicillium chermesinum]